MCCTAGLPMQMAMNMLLARAKPDRLLIEPTGLGHPYEVLAALTTDYYQQLLDLRATLTMVDARKISDERYTKHSTFNEQLKIADVIVATKSDGYRATDLEKLKQYLSRNAWLAERQLIVPNDGFLPLTLLDKPRKAWQLPNPVASSMAAVNKTAEGQGEVQTEFPPAGYIKLSNSGDGFVSHGWIFRDSFVFDRKALATLIRGTSAERVKALIRTKEGHVGYNFSGEEVQELMLRPLSDSRLELIADRDFLLTDFEEKLLATVQTT